MLHVDLVQVPAPLGLLAHGLLPAYLRISLANMGPKRCHQSLTVSWQMSIPRSCSKCSTLRSDRGVFHVHHDHQPDHLRRVVEPEEGIGRRLTAGHALPYRIPLPPQGTLRPTEPLQTFASVYSTVHNHFNQERHLVSREIYKESRDAALAAWRTVTGTSPARIWASCVHPETSCLGLTAPSNPLSLTRPSGEPSPEALIQRTGSNNLSARGLRWTPSNVGETVARRTLVITLGQLRAASHAFEPFRKHLLEALDADLAVCLPADDQFDILHPLYQAARYRWAAPQPDDMAEAFDTVQAHLGGTEDWRGICDVRGHWIGGIKQAGQPTVTALLLYLRWFMLNNIEAADLRDIYDTFVITRSDFLFTCPHPPTELLDPKFLWIPNGEDYGGVTPGLTDRHLVVSSNLLKSAVDLIEPLLLSSSVMRDVMIRKEWNMEQYFGLHLARNGMFNRVRRFPYVMYLVRTDTDTTQWSEGRYEQDVGAFVKYPAEYWSAKAFQPLLRDAADWRLHFDLDALIGHHAEGWTLVMNEPLFNDGAESRKTRAMFLFSDLFGRVKAQADPETVYDDARCQFLIFALRHVAVSQADAFQDLWVLHETGRARDGWFVELGGGGQAAMSNTRLLEQDFGWRSRTLAEVSAEAGERCRIDYMSVSAEAADSEVFLMLDFQRLDVRHLTVQHPLAVRRDAIHALLTLQGFARKFTFDAKQADFYVKR